MVGEFAVEGWFPDDVGGNFLECPRFSDLQAAFEFRLLKSQVWRSFRYISTHLLWGGRASLPPRLP